MSHSTFKTAFWTMLLAFSLTVVLTGIRPDELRSALHPDSATPQQFTDLRKQQPLPAAPREPSNDHTDILSAPESKKVVEDVEILADLAPLEFAPIEAPKPPPEPVHQPFPSERNVRLQVEKSVDSKQQQLMNPVPKIAPVIVAETPVAPVETKSPIPGAGQIPQRPSPAQRPMPESWSGRDPFEQQLAAQKVEEKPKELIVESVAPQPPQAVQTPIPEMREPIRIASSDPDASVASAPNSYLIFSPHTSDSPVKESAAPQSETKTSPSKTKIEPYKKRTPQVEITVPDPPVRSQVSASPVLIDGLSQIHNQVLELRLEEALREISELRERQSDKERPDDSLRIERELSLLRDSIQELSTKQRLNQEMLAASAPNIARPESPKKSESPQPAKAHFRPKINVTEGSQPGRFSFRFENVEIRRALEVISEHAQRRVVVEPEISGIFSGEILDVEPRQAFATFVKAHGFGVSAKGDYVLVRQQPLSKAR